MDATPIARIGHPATAMRYAPEAVAMPNAVTMPAVTSSADSHPRARTRGGPSRAGESAPFLKS
jgi:hypothetical protein